MNVLFIDHTSLVSGAQRALLDLLRALPEDVNATVLCPSGQLADEVRRLGVDVDEIEGTAGSLRLHPRHTAAAIAQIMRSARTLSQLAKARDADIVHANSLRAGLIAAAARRAAAPPYLVHVHDALPASRSARVVRALLRRTAAGAITISRYTSENFTGGPRTSYRIYMLSNPLDTARFDPERISRSDARRRIGADPSAVIIGHIAQITPWKGQDIAIRALRQVHAEHPDARLWIVGEAKFTDQATRYDNLAYLEGLRAEITQLGLGDHVEFLGEREDVEVVVRALDVLVAPSWEEPFGRSIIEAMALETPVVATDVGGPAEFIEHERDGLLATPLDTSEWARAIEWILDDRTRAEQMARRASAKVRAAFDSERYARRMVSVYHEVLRGGVGLANARQAVSEHAGRALDEPLRVLLVEHTSVIGGGQRSLLELMRCLRGSDDLTLACPEGELAEAARALGVAVETIPPSQLTFRFALRTTPRELYRAVQARSAVKALIARLRPQLVHANSLRAGLLAVKHGESQATVVHCRDLLPRSIVSKAVREVVLLGNSTVVAVSRAAARRLGGRFWRTRSIVVIDNPVDPARFDPETVRADTARSTIAPAAKPLVGVVAQLTPWKGQDRAVRMLARLREEYPQAQLALAGTAKFIGSATRFDNQAYERSLHELIDSLGLSESVIFLGDRSDPETVMAALDVLLVPSSEEPFGRTVIEALAMGVPVVATSEGGPGEVLRQPRDGATVAPDDIDAWVRAITEYVERGRNADSRTYAVERFSADRHAEQMRTLYRYLTSRN